MIIDAGQASIGMENPKFFKHFKSLFGNLKTLGHNRNDIAHGVVVPFYSIAEQCYKPENGYSIIPSYADTSKMNMKETHLWIPNYSLTSAEMNIYAQRFEEFRLTIKKLTSSLSDVSDL